MTANATTWVVLGALIVGTFGYIAVMVIRDVREPRNLPIRAAHTPHPAAKRMYQPGWPIVYTHSAPARPFTPDQAHAAMQLHRECDPERCPRRKGARRALIDAGHLTPAGHVVRRLA